MALTAVAKNFLMIDEVNRGKCDRRMAGLAHIAGRVVIGHLG